MAGESAGCFSSDPCGAVARQCKVEDGGVRRSRGEEVDVTTVRRITQLFARPAGARTSLTWAGWVQYP